MPSGAEKTSLKPAGQSAAPFPEWFPGWARELSTLYTSGTTCLFILHGNVHDLQYCPTEDGADYRSVSEFLASQIFGSWDLVLQYDLARGLRPLSGSDAQRHQAMMGFLTKRIGDPANWPRDPDSLFLVLDRLIERNLIEDN